MKPAISVVLCVFLLSDLGPGFARAGTVTLVTTPFNGLTTNYRTLPSEVPLPYTDVFGRTVSGGGFISPGLIGLSIGASAGSPSVATWSNLAVGTNEAGITISSIDGPGTGNLVGAMFSNGDTFSGSVSLSTGQFVGFTDTTPFTTMSLDFAGLPIGSYNITDFRTATVSSVPEPSSLVIWGTVIAASTCAAALRHRRVRRGGLVH
jgi:hypothetical protein